MATAKEDDTEPAGAQPPPPPPQQQQQTTPSRTDIQRQKPSDRLNEILENALHRAETLDPDSLTVIRRNSSRRMTTEARSDDETTGIISRGSGRSYQAVHIAGNTNSNTARSRKGSQGNGQKKQPGGPRDQSASRHQDDDAAQSDAEPTDESSSRWWKTTLSKFHSVELDNTGSVARDHLALERTFLAWMRTSLSFASIGVAVTQLFRLNTNVSEANTSGMDENRLRQMGRPLGATFLAISIVTLLLGLRRYFHSQEWIMKGKFPASRGTVLIMAFVALALMLLSLVVVIVIQPSGNAP